jgi:hypothetical protein
MRMAGAAVILAAALLASVAKAEACGPPLAGDGVPITLKLPLSETDRLTLGRSIREAWIASAGDLDKLEQALRKTPPCTPTTFTAGDRTFAVLGGEGQGPFVGPFRPTGRSCSSYRSDRPIPSCSASPAERSSSLRPIGALRAKSG